jgi:hypothetical protein
MILRRGKQPSAVDCFIHENVAVVIVRLAINAAKLAMRKTGQKTPPARHGIKLVATELNVKSSKCKTGLNSTLYHNK